jgi:hypothetical protein
VHDEVRQAPGRLDAFGVPLVHLVDPLPRGGRGLPELDVAVDEPLPPDVVRQVDEPDLGECPADLAPRFGVRTTRVAGSTAIAPATGCSMLRSKVGAYTVLPVSPAIRRRRAR